MVAIFFFNTYYQISPFFDPKTKNVTNNKKFVRKKFGSLTKNHYLCPQNLIINVIN